MEKTLREKIDRYRSDVRQTRAFGSCYIPVWNREPVTDTQTGIRYSWAPYGRSFQGGGHKCKAYAHLDGKPATTGVFFNFKPGRFQPDRAFFWVALFSKMPYLIFGNGTKTLFIENKEDEFME